MQFHAHAAFVVVVGPSQSEQLVYLENAASDGFGSNFSRTVLTNMTIFYSIFVDNLAHKPAGCISLAASGRQQSATEYCLQVRKTGPTGKESNNSVTV